MKSRSIPPAIAQSSAALALALACTTSGAIGLGQMEATASENAVAPESNSAATSVDTPVQALFTRPTGQASASSGAVQWTAAASGGDSVDHYDGVASAWSSFILWNTTLDQALTPSELTGLSLSFNFVLSGSGSFIASANAIASGVSSVNANTELLLGSIQNVSNGGTVVLGPSGLAATGVLAGSTGTTFGASVPYAINVDNVSATSGTLFGFLAVSDGATQSAWDLRLVSVQQTGSNTAPMALRFSDNRLVAISAVPEPQAWALLAAGLLVVGLKRSRSAA